MNIEQIYSRNIIRAPRSCTLQEAALLMRRHHVGALLVTEDEPGQREVIGIVTDRDLVLEAMAGGMDPADGALDDVMTSELVTVSETADIREAMEIMRENGVRRLAVSNGDGMLVGIVSLDDVIDALGAEVASLTGILKSEREREIVQRGDA